jgi:hypothetical protein
VFVFVIKAGADNQSASLMSIIMDLVAGFVALVGLFVGTILYGPIERAFSIPYIAVILGIIGLVIAGVGFKKHGWVGAFIVGIGLGLAVALTSMFPT